MDTRHSNNMRLLVALTADMELLLQISKDNEALAFVLMQRDGAVQLVDTLNKLIERMPLQ